jgi:hypothetical protein
MVVPDITYHGFVWAISMRFYINRSMWGCKSAVTRRWHASERWLAYADFMILVMRDVIGLLRKRWREVRIVESDLTVRWHRQIGVLDFRWHN